MSESIAFCRRSTHGTMRHRAIPAHEQGEGSSTRDARIGKTAVEFHLCGPSRAALLKLATAAERALMGNPERELAMECWKEWVTI